jgi:hypothetical protein
MSENLRDSTGLPDGWYWVSACYERGGPGFWSHPFPMSLFEGTWIEVQDDDPPVDIRVLSEALEEPVMPEDLEKENRLR